MSSAQEGEKTDDQILQRWRVWAISEQFETMQSVCSQTFTILYLQPALSSGFPNSVSQRLGAHSEDREKAFMHGPQTALTMFPKIELR